MFQATKSRTPFTRFAQSTRVSLKMTTPLLVSNAPRWFPGYYRGEHRTNATVAHNKKTAILFPGQGSQFVGMGRDLYDTFEVARQVVDEADEALGGNLKEIMFHGSQEDLTKTENAQPAILTTSIAMLRVLQREKGLDLGGSYDFALGHSLGEYSALVATGALPLSDAVKLVRLRGLAMSNAVTDKGTTAMSALVVRPGKLSELVKTVEAIQSELYTDEVAEIANINSSFQVVLSGTAEGVRYASRVLQFLKIAARAVDLPVSAPFHCALMQPAAEEMTEALKAVDFKQPSTSVVSNVTARPLLIEDDISALLIQQVTGTVQWHESINFLREQGVSDFLCIGPGKVLANLLKKEYPHDNIQSMATAQDIFN